MARAIDVITIAPQSNGWDMVTNARASHAAPSSANGVYPVGVVDAAQNHSASTASALGTRSNVDLGTPNVIEAV